MTARTRRFSLAALCLAQALALGLVLGCQVDVGTGKGAASVLGKGLVNDPKNKSLRFEMIEFGLHEFCKQLLVSGAPLRLDDDQPVIGRYFADECQTKSLDKNGRQTIIAQFSGRGYAWTLGTGRLGFRASGLLEMAPDFMLHQGAMYVYFRPMQVDTSDFEVLLTEEKLTQAVMGVAGLDEQELGRAIIDAQLGRGFTVVRYDADGYTDFALGLVERGDVPFRPYQVISSPKDTLANGRSELFRGQQDYLGKLEVGKGEAITLTLDLEGTGAIDVAVLSAAGSPIDEYIRKPGPRHAPERPAFQAVLTSRAPLKAEVDVPPGSYFLVFDHSSALGSTNPDDKDLPARVDYLIQRGKRDK